MHDDGELIWWLSHGMAAPDGRLAMPGFEDVLTEDERWILIDYIRAHNAGLAMQKTGAWPIPMQAPAFQARCAGGRTVTLAELRGHEVLLVIGEMAAKPVAPDGVISVFTRPGDADQTGPAGCVATDGDIPRAYAIVSGLSPDRVENAQFLIDSHGWLRDLRRPGTNPDWTDPTVLARAVAGIRAHPMSDPGSNHANMQM